MGRHLKMANGNVVKSKLHKFEVNYVDGHATSMAWDNRYHDRGMEGGREEIVD